MREIVCGVLMLIGASFLLLASIGVVRMPDVYTRMSPATKGSTLGVSCMLLAVAVYFSDVGVTSRALATIAFFLLTAPVTAHMIGRAAYFVGTPLWEGTVIDELHGRYDLQTHELSSTPREEAIRNIGETRTGHAQDESSLHPPDGPKQP